MRLTRVRHYVVDTPVQKPNLYTMGKKETAELIDSLPVACDEILELDPQNPDNAQLECKISSH